MAAEEGWAGVELLCAALDRHAARLEGYDFVPACEPIRAAEPATLLHASPDARDAGRAMLAVCDGGRQLAIARWALPALHRAARERRAWRARAKHGGGAGTADRPFAAPAPRATAPASADARAAAARDERELEQSSRVLALLNGHCYSAWHARKRLLLAPSVLVALDAPPSGASCPRDADLPAPRVPAADRSERALDGFSRVVSLRGELALSALVLRRFAAAPDAWAHRRWLLSRAGAGPPSRAPAASAGDPPPSPATRASTPALADMDAELERCDAACAAKRANYYAAQQRAWLLARLARGPLARAAAAALAAAPAVARAAAVGGRGCGLASAGGAESPEHPKRASHSAPARAHSAAAADDDDGGVAANVATATADDDDGAADGDVLLRRELVRTSALLRAHPSDPSARHSRQLAILAALRTVDAATAGDGCGRARALPQPRELAEGEVTFARALLTTFAAGAAGGMAGGEVGHGGRTRATTDDTADGDLGFLLASERAGRPQPHAVLFAHLRFATELCAQLALRAGLEPLDAKKQVRGSVSRSVS
ncbi:hypothetical protein KFE25_005236 [Diacronema lutheri]|uniref:Uncharacterized protein n=1 Tax=Diacronema lutheri TaxID=2081491 RepID=A0A8J5XDT3_DIALT|nr:hypothetical protein KFE25_005236 [Diacronema lutheri]